MKCPVIHIDDSFSRSVVLSKLSHIEGDVVVDGIYFDPKERRLLIDTYRGNGARCIFLDTPVHIREERLGHKIKHDFPFNAPTLEEGWDEIIIIRGDYEQRICRQD